MTGDDGGLNPILRKCRTQIRADAEHELLYKQQALQDTDSEDNFLHVSSRWRH